MNRIFGNDAAKRISSLAIRHRFGILVACIICYIVFKPRSVPHLSTNDQKSSAPLLGQNLSNAIDQTNTFLQLFDPSENSADPKWSTAAGLKATELQDFAAQLDKVLKDFAEVERLIEAQHFVVFVLTKPEVKNALWPGVNSQKLKDVNLARDWYELVKVRYESVPGITIYADDFIDKGNRSYIANRLETIQVRVMGGKLLTGDVLSLKSITAFTDEHLKYLQKVNPQLAGVAKRICVEFPQLSENVIYIPSLRDRFPGVF